MYDIISNVTFIFNLILCIFIVMHLYELCHSVDILQCFFSYYSFPRNLVCFILNLVSFLSLAIPKLGIKTALNSKYIWQNQQVIQSQEYVKYEQLMTQIISLHRQIKTCVIKRSLSQKFPRLTFDRYNYARLSCRHSIQLSLMRDIGKYCSNIQFLVLIVRFFEYLTRLNTDALTVFRHD